MAIGDNFYSDGPLRQHPRCKRCGDENVMWLIVKNKWRLCNNETGEPHVCPAAIRAKQDFSALKKSTRKKRPSSPRTSASIEPVGNYKWELTGSWATVRIHFREEDRKWLTLWKDRISPHGALQQALLEAYNIAMGYI